MVKNFNEISEISQHYEYKQLGELAILINSNNVFKWISAFAARVYLVLFAELQTSKHIPIADTRWRGRTRHVLYTRVLYIFWLCNSSTDR